MAPLTGIRVVDVSRLLPGPWCTALLADLGADVVKVEPWPTGDPLRRRRARGVVDDRGFALVNRKKRSLALDWRQPNAMGVVQRLASVADVFVEGFRPGVADELGIGWTQLSAINPRLVYVSISAFGGKGPRRDQPAHDINVLAASGILEALRVSDNAAPGLPGIPLADIAAGITAALGSVAALRMRDHTGEGQHVEVTMAESVVPWLFFAWAGWLNQDATRWHTGAFACYNVYSTADGGYVACGMMERKWWQAFCEHVGHPEWVALQFEPAAQAELIRELQGVFAQRTQAEWEAVGQTLPTCLTGVRGVAAVAGNPEWRSRGPVGTIHVGDETIPGFFAPIHFSRSGIVPVGRVPRVGEDGPAVLRAWGWAPSEVEALVASGVLGSPPATRVQS